MSKDIKVQMLLTLKGGKEMGEGYKQKHQLDTMKLDLKRMLKYIYNFQIYTVISTTWLRAGITPEV